MRSIPTKLSTDQITAILKRCFGSDIRPFEVQELSGGTFNETYHIDSPLKSILRIAPPASHDTYWDDVVLMRREHTILPFFAAIAAFLPTTLFTDFTHQVIERDFVLQTFLEGDRWSDIEDELTEEENIELWRQCGEIVRRIHNTTGELFGYPYPGNSFASWHEVIVDRFSRIAQSLKEAQAEIPEFYTILDLVFSARSVFDEVQTAHLLHGDLWTFNLLVKRQNERPIITGVLDTERAWWGDPMADWIMFLLSIRSGEDEWQERISAFHKGYGVTEPGPTLQFRREVYTAMHVGSSVVWAARHGNREDVERGRADLQKVAGILRGLAE